MEKCQCRKHRLYTGQSVPQSDCFECWQYYFSSHLDEPVKMKHLSRILVMIQTAWKAAHDPDCHAFQASDRWNY